MYGYFRPRNSRLTGEEYKLFHAYYCRICYNLRILGGQPARFFTTHDMAVFSLALSLAYKQERPKFHYCERFATRVMHEFDNDTIGHQLANMTIIVFGEKIRDDEIDGNYIRAGGMNMLFRNTVIKACAAEPEMARIARESTDRINQMQDARADVFEILDVYGQMLVDMFQCIVPLEEKYQKIFRSIAKWCFYIDMLYDYNKDYKENAYNGFRIEGCPTIRECFDTNYLLFIKSNQRVTDELRQAVHEANDGSMEWKILNKIIDHALGSTTLLLLSTPKEKFDIYWELFKENPCFFLPRRITSGE